MRYREIIREAKAAGRHAGEAAASWATDGNTTPETARRIIDGYNDGDPEICDAFRVPDLSGEYAGDPTPQSLAEDLALDTDRDPDGTILDEACNAWVDAASDAFWSVLIRDCRRIAE